MRGLMMDIPLSISSILEHAAEIYPNQVVVSKAVDGAVTRHPYSELRRRAKQLGAALRELGVAAGDRVATIAWNNQRHLEIYYGVSGSGAVVHTINPRLHPEQIAYLLEHAGDKYVFVDETFVPLLAKLPAATRERCKPIVLGAEYDALLEGKPDDEPWPTFDERSAASICYTSGTTGEPKGVVYSHRSTVLHALGASAPAAMPVGEHDSMLPIVPMFHVGAWGFPYSVPMNGGKLVMPGPHLDGPALWQLMRDEGVTFSAGVPTIWQRVLAEMDARGPLPDLKRVIIGGSAVPQSMIEAFTRHGVEVVHAWGMTETSPLGCTSKLKPQTSGWSDADKLARQCKQGRAVFGVQMRIVDDDRNVLPHDGKAFGELEVRGPWVRSAYYRDEEPSASGGTDWFPTGDVATIDPDAYMQITDRKKDLIKSGGEWISSIELENLAMGHAEVQLAAVIGVPHPEWSERPVMFVVAAPGASPSAESLTQFLSTKVPKWWLPDRIEFVDALPIGATGKVLKTELRKGAGACPKAT